MASELDTSLAAADVYADALLELANDRGVTDEQIASLTSVLIGADFRRTYAYTGAEFDNLVVTETAGSRDEFTLDVDWGDGNVE